MVSENVEKSKEQNKGEPKADTSKAKVSENIVNASCAKLHELFSCQRVAHSVIFYVIIFLVLVVLLYIFRKFVSFPSGKYNSRKHNATASSAGSSNPTNDSLSKEFPTKWPKLNTILKTIRPNAPESSDLSSEREKKNRIYSVPGNPLQGQDHFGNKANLNPTQYTYNKGYDNRDDFNSHAYYSSPNIDEDTNNKKPPDKFSTSNYGGSYGYRQTPVTSSVTDVPSSSGFTNTQYDWSSQQYNRNNDLKLSDPNWKNTWTSAAWDINSNLRSWPYSDTSGSGAAKQKLQQNTDYQNFPIPTSSPNVYKYDTWDSTANSQAKWEQPGSGFGWIKSIDYDNVNSYKSTNLPKSNNFYYDRASGRWGPESKDTYNFKNELSNQNTEESNSYSTDINKAWNAYSWNPYLEYWGANQTHDWSNFNYPTRNYNSEPGGNSNLWNNEATIKSGKTSTHGMSDSTLKDENDVPIHRWPLEDNREVEAPKPHPTTFVSRKKKKVKQSWKRNKKMRNPKVRISLNKRKKIRNKKRYTNVKKKKEEVKDNRSPNHVKKSVIPHSTFSSSFKKRRKKQKEASSEKSPGKHISRKVDQRKKQRSRNRDLKLTHNTMTKTRKQPKKQKHLMGKWQRKVHHIKHCKKLQSFQSNGKVHMDKKYLHKQRKYKYTILSCRYARIPNHHKNDDDDWDDLDDDDDDNEDEINFKRKKICQKFYFITNGKIRLQKIAEKGSQISYLVSLCRAIVKPKTRKLGKIRTVNRHYHQTTHSVLKDGNDRRQKNIDNNTTDDDNVLANQKNKVTGGLTQSTKHRTKGYQTGNDDNDDDYDTETFGRKNTKKSGNNDKDDDIDDDFDIETNSEHKNAPKHTIKGDAKDVGEHKLRKDNDFYDESSDEKIHSQMRTKSNVYINRQIKVRRPDKLVQNDNEDDLDGDLDLDDDPAPKHIIKGDSRNIDENEYRDSSDDNDFNAGASNKKIHAPGETENSIQIKALRPNKIKQNHNEDDLDIDDIDDTDDDNITGYSKVTRAPQKTDNGVTGENDDTLDSNELDYNLDDDLDIMNIDLRTTSRPSRVKGKKARKKHKPTENKSASTKHKSHNKNNLKQLLHQFTKDIYTNDKSDVTKTLLEAILKKKLVSISASKHAKSKLVKRKRKHHSVLHKAQNERNIKALLGDDMLTSSNGVKSLSQIMKTELPKNTKPTTPTPHTKLSVKDLLKEFLPRVFVKPTISPTQKQTVAPTTPDTKMKMQFAKLLKKFGFTSNVPAKKAIADNLEIHKSTSASSNSDVTAKKSSSLPLPSQLSSPVPKLSPLPSQPLSKQMLSPPPSQQPIASSTPSPPQQQQQQQTAAQLPQSPPSNPPTQPKFPATSPEFRYPNTKTSQEQATIPRSFIPTIKPQLVAQISRPAAIPQAQRLVKNIYGNLAYSSNTNNLYDSYQKQQSTNVLCFGDSLTSGFYNHGKGKHPYSIKLNELLNPQGSHHYNVETRGVVGEMVHGSMTKRLPKILDEDTHFDWVLILGGTNDVAHVKNFGDDQDFTRQLIGVWSPKIVKDIEKLHEIARSYGSRTVLMTIPETAYELWSEFRSIRNMRLSVNAALRKYATEVRDTTVLCDLAYKLPRSTLSQEMQKLYWNDHIHLNPFGYDKMAEIILQCIQPYLNK